MSEEEDRFLFRSRWAEAEFEDVAEFALSVALDACSLLSRRVLGEGHRCVNRLPIFTCGFLLDQLVESVANPTCLFFNLTKDCLGVHGWDVIAIK